jgi:hypothetical protein
LQEGNKINGISFMGMGEPFANSNLFDALEIITNKRDKLLTSKNNDIDPKLININPVQVQNEINILTNTGDYNLTVSGNLNEFVQGNAKKYALGTMRNMSDGDAQMHSFTGKLDVGAQKTIDVKSMGEDIVIESVGKNPDSRGAVLLKSPESVYGVTDTGVTTLTTKTIRSKAAENIDYEVAPEIDTIEPPEDDAEVPSECDIGDTLPIDGFTGAVGTLVETAIIAATVLATQGGDSGGTGPQRGGRPGPGRGGR